MAGIAAKLGGDAIAQMLRNKAFGAKARELLIQSIQRDDAIVQKLISEAEQANRELLERVLLPPPGKTTIPLGVPTRESGVQVIPASKGEPGRAPTGQFKKTFKSN
ncbi:MAG TPA: hypothetical protein ENI23_05740 [bacterium]|nr:hypothetical protein [bacterium]